MKKQLSIINAKIVAYGINECGNYTTEDYEFKDLRQDTIDIVEEFWEEECEEDIKNKKKVLKYLRTQEDLYKLFKYIIKLCIWTTPYLKTRIEFIVDGEEHDYTFKPTKKYQPPQQSKSFVSRLYW